MVILNYRWLERIIWGGWGFGLMNLVVWVWFCSWEGEVGGFRKGIECVGGLV